MRTKTLLTAFFLMFWGMTACAQKGNTHHNFIRKIDDAILKYKKTKVDNPKEWKVWYVLGM